MKQKTTKLYKTTILKGFYTGILLTEIKYDYFHCIGETEKTTEKQVFGKIIDKKIILSKRRGFCGRMPIVYDLLIC